MSNTIHYANLTYRASNRRKLKKHGKQSGRRRGTGIGVRVQTAAVLPADADDRGNGDGDFLQPGCMVGLCGLVYLFLRIGNLFGFVDLLRPRIGFRFRGSALGYSQVFHGGVRRCRASLHPALPFVFDECAFTIKRLIRICARIFFLAWHADRLERSGIARDFYYRGHNILYLGVSVVRRGADFWVNKGE